ncbi:TPA: hypothetical protein ACK0KV_003727 [Raoultella ornithinolytica]
MIDETEIEASEFDIWYQQLITILATNGLRAPYKMAWIDFFNDGKTPEEAIEMNHAFISKV